MSLRWLKQLWIIPCWFKMGWVTCNLQAKVKVLTLDMTSHVRNLKRKGFLATKILAMAKTHGHLPYQDQKIQVFPDLPINHWRSLKLKTYKQKSILDTNGFLLTDWEWTTNVLSILLTMRNQAWTCCRSLT